MHFTHKNKQKTNYITDKTHTTSQTSMQVSNFDISVLSKKLLTMQYFLLMCFNLHKLFFFFENVSCRQFIFRSHTLEIKRGVSSDGAAWFLEGLCMAIVKGNINTLYIQRNRAPMDFFIRTNQTDILLYVLAPEKANGVHLRSVLQVHYWKHLAMWQWCMELS